MADGRKNNGNKGHSTKSKHAGRPRLELCEDDILRMAQTGLTDEEIAHILQVSASTLHNFRTTLKEGRANLAQSIKRTQLEVALKERDKTMLIWVGKQYAKQKDKHDVEHSGEVASPQVVFYGSNPPKSWKEEQDA